MKRTLSIILAIMMILSTVSFAAPSMAGVVTGVEEASEAVIEDAASLFEEEQEEPILLKEFTFDTDAEGWYAEDVGNGYSGGMDGNGLFTITSDAGKTDPRIANKSLSFKTQYVTKIEIKVKKSCTDAQSFQLFYFCNGAGANAANMAQKTYSTTNEWNVLTFETKDFKGTWEGRFTGMRLDAGIIPEAVYSLDYVRIYGYVAPPNFKPGYNMLTGTEDLVDFDDLANTTASDGSLEDGEGNVLFTYNTAQTSNLSVVNSPVSGETGKSLMFSGYLYEKAQAKTYYELYPQLYTKDVVRYEAPEDGRPVLIKYDIFSQKQFDETATKYTGGATASYPLFRDKLNGKGNGSYSYSCYAYNESPAWTHAHVLDENSGVKGLANIQLTAHVYADGYDKATNGTIGNTADDVDVVRHYMDNIGYYPYYKVTYMNGDSVVDTKWILDDGNGNILESFNPSTQGVEYPEGKNGWSLTDGGDKVTSVALENEDIVLYAIAGAPDSTDELLYAYEFNNQSEESYFTSNVGSTVQLAIEKGNAVFNFDVMKTDGTWNDSRLTTTSSSIPNMKLSDMKRIAIRFRPSKLDSYVQDGVVKEYSWTNSFENVVNSNGRVQICASANGWKYPVDAYFKNYTADADGYYTIDVDVSAKTAGIDITPTNFLVLMHQNLKAPVKFEIDYLRIYGNKGAEFSPSLNAPQKVAENSLGLRVDSAETTGVRFKSSIANSVREKAALAEYGWIVALGDVLGKNELTHQFKLDNGKTAYVTGKNYCKAENLDKIYETGADYTVFTAVVTGVPVEYADKYLVVRPYSVIGGAYVYGESIITSPRDVGQKIYDKWVADGSPAGDTNYDYVKYQEYIDALGIKK